MYVEELCAAAPGLGSRILAEMHERSGRAVQLSVHCKRQFIHAKALRKTTGFDALQASGGALLGTVIEHATGRRA